VAGLVALVGRGWLGGFGVLRCRAAVPCAVWAESVCLAAVGCRRGSRGWPGPGSASGSAGWERLRFARPPARWALVARWGCGSAWAGRLGLARWGGLAPGAQGCGPGRSGGRGCGWRRLRVWLAAAAGVAGGERPPRVWSGRAI